MTKNHAADSNIRPPKKIDFRAGGTHESHPTVWEVNMIILSDSIIKKVQIRP